MKSYQQTQHLLLLLTFILKRLTLRWGMSTIVHDIKKC